MSFNKYSYKNDGSGYKVLNSATNNTNEISILDQLASCTCSTFLQYEMPCRHLLFVMKSIVDLKPYIAQRWLKHFLISKTTQVAYSQSIETQFEASEPSNIWSQLGDSVRNKNPTKVLKIQNENEKYNLLKNVFDQISKI